MKKIIITVLLTMVFTTALQAQKKLDIEKYFKTNNLTGTVVIANLSGDKIYVYNPERAEQEFLPASTFKIPNTLIALEENIFSATDTFKWDGTQYSIQDWNADQTLESAFKVSCVWCYQQLARKLSLEKYQEWLTFIEYGNAKTGPVLDEFWLSGDIRISATQQIDFLRRFCSESLPFAEENMAAVKKIMLADENPKYKLYGKTGWAVRVDEKVGWYVGFVEVKDEVWLFACNIDMSNDQNAPHRKGAVYAGLKELGIIKGN